MSGAGTRTDTPEDIRLLRYMVALSRFDFVSSFDFWPSPRKWMARSMELRRLTKEQRNIDPTAELWDEYAAGSPHVRRLK